MAVEQYHDRLRITTPEGIELELELAGLGSRFSATLIDLALKTAIVLGLELALAGLGAAGVAAVVVASFAVYFGYDIVFELLAGGRTPGKRASGLRVLRDAGAAVDLPASAVRNVMRLVDGLPLLYLPGMAAIVLTRRNQRLGDLAAGTVVVRERQGGRKQAAPVTALPASRAAMPAAADVSGVSDDEIATVRSFLDRREGFERDARARLAQQLAAALRPKVVGAFGAHTPEEFLEQLVQAKASS